MTISERISGLLSQVELMGANNAEELEALRIKYLSKKGEIAALFGEFRNVPKEQKQELGAQLNALKDKATEKMNCLKEQFEQATQLQDKPDLTRTPDPIALGTRHPLSLVREEIIEIFSRIGFVVADGPEVEDDQHVFGMLNFAPEHPARDMQDTFFIEKEQGVQKPTDILLRTHTSSVQTRVMTTQKPPIRVLCPGRVYRNEAISARAHCFFHRSKACTSIRTSALLTFAKYCSTSPKSSLAPRRRSASVRPTSPSPNPVPRWISRVISAAEQVAVSAKVQVGLRFSVAVWSIPTYLRVAA